MGYFDGVYAIWVREITVFLREKERVVSAAVTPLLWIFAVGGGLGASVEISGMSYQMFMFPGIVAMAILFGSIFYGMYIIWDRKLDFLKEVLVAPVPRSAVFMGKMLGGMSDALIQAAILLLIGLAFGFVSGLPALLLALAFAAIVAMCLVSLGLIIGANMKSPEGFNLVMSFVMWPMFMLSGALFPVENLPSYIDIVVKLNPLTYGVDLMRLALLGTSNFGMLYDICVLLLATVVFAYIGSRSFERMQI
jgi:ABC-2 type transport system permease protein